MPSSVPTLLTALPSTQPTSSINQSVGPSSLPSLSNYHLSDTPSEVPTLSTLPTYLPSSTQNPTSPPTEGYVVQGREFNPCKEGRVVLGGANVTLFSVLGQQIGQTTTDSEGLWEFTGLPIGRYYSVTDYPECRRLHGNDRYLHPKEIDLSTSISDEQQIKFFKTGDMCNSKISLGDWDVFSNEDWIEVALFDTLDECCVHLFFSDIAGCLKRSRITFKFEFCVDVSGLDGLLDCPLSEIHAIQNAMQTGLDKSSNLTLTEIGDIVLTNANGEIQCSRSEYSNEFLSLSSRTNVCGTVTGEEACREEQCLKNAFKRVSSKFKGFFDDKEFSSQLLRSLSRDTSASGSLARLESVDVAKNSFVTKNLLLPLTVTSSPSPSRIVDRQNDKPLEYSSSTTSSQSNRFYPTFVSGQLCRSKYSFDIDSWEESYETLKECCKTHFFWDYEACCKTETEGMGGC